MKLEDTKKVLEEAIKFTNKEIKLVKQEAKDILVGIEYEYNVDLNKAKKYIIHDIDSTEPEEMSIDDVYETDEYMNALSEIENRMIEEQLNEAEEEFKNERNKQFLDDIHYYDLLEFIDKLNSEIQNRNAEHLFRWTAHWDLFNGNMATASSMGGIENVSQQTREELFSFANNLKIVQDIFDNVDYEVLYDMHDSDLNLFVHESHVKFFQELEDFYESIEKLQEIEIPIFVGFDLTSKQTAFEFENYVEDFNDFLIDAQDFLDYIDSFELGMSSNGLGGIIENIRGFTTEISDEIENAIDREWETEEKEFALNRFQEEVWLHAAADEVDLMDVIRDIQNNQGVIVVNYEGEPYLDTDGIGMSKFKLIHNILPRWGISVSDIVSVAADPSVPNGVETITKPLPLNEALYVMKNMFKHISDIGSTADNTGMHVNISIRGLDFIKHDFNPIKLVMLADPKLLNEFFPVRGYVEHMLDIDNIGIINIANKNIPKYFSKNVQLDKKYQGINFSHMKNFIETRRRIEFRYFGGDGYEQRYNTLEWNIYRFAYLMLASFSEGFAENEYKKAIIKYLDNEIRSSKFFKDLKIKSFNELRTIMLKNNLYTYLELEEFMETKNK